MGVIFCLWLTVPTFHPSPPPPPPLLSLFLSHDLTAASCPFSLPPPPSPHPVSWKSTVLSFTSCVLGKGQSSTVRCAPQQFRLVCGREIGTQQPMRAPQNLPISETIGVHQGANAAANERPPKRFNFREDRRASGAKARARKPCRIDVLLPLKFRTQTVSSIQNILTKNLETICRVILAKTSQKMIVNLLLMVLIYFTIINITSVALFVVYDIWGFFFSHID